MSPMQVKTVFLLAIAAPAVEGIKVHGADPCACLNWADAYTHIGGATCGSTGRELTFAGSEKTARENAGAQFCKGFFERINDNFCVSWDFSGASMSGKQWCYVSPECKELGGGTLRLSRDKTRQVAYKTCTDEDQKLVMKTPNELAEVAAKNHIDLGLLSKWAYPVPGKFASIGQAEKDLATNSSYATVWDSANGIAPYFIISANGISQFVIDWTTDGRKAFQEGRLDPNGQTGLTCMPQFGLCEGPTPTLGPIAQPTAQASKPSWMNPFKRRGSWAR